MGGYVSVGPGFMFNMFNDLRGDENLTDDLIKQIRANNVQHIQVNYIDLEKFSTKTWQKLNKEVFAHKPGIYLRLFGYGSGLIDLSMLKHLDKVENLAIDGATVQNAEYLGALPRLTQLTYETANPESYEVFNNVNANLQKLIIGCEEAKYAKTDLSPLLRFKKLDYLFLIGHNKNLADIIPQFVLLEELILKKIKTIRDINFVTKLPALKKLHIKGGSIKNLDVLSELTDLGYLELYNAAAIENLDFLKQLANLNELFLQSINTPTAFPDLRKLKNLKRIELMSLKRLKDFSGLEHVPNLQKFICEEIKEQEPEDFIPLLKNKSIKYYNILFPTDKKREQLETLFAEYGKKNRA